jgi:2-methylcitrate dehydratase PrpD
MDLAYLLAANAVSRKFTDLSSPDRGRHRRRIDRQPGLRARRHHSHGSPQARSALGRWGNTGCSVWGGFGRAPAPFAAFLNAVSMHALDYDDTDDKVPLHAFGMVLPGPVRGVEESAASSATAAIS